MEKSGDADVSEWLCARMGAAQALPLERVQSLWSGYGEIRRYALEGAAVERVIVKDVRPPASTAGTTHPRGWQGERSHARKLRSYNVECAFYARYAERCDDDARVPQAYAHERSPTGWRIALEDLDSAAAGAYSGRRGRVTRAEAETCLRWLAAFHATYMGERELEGLWPVGTYWHLETRPDELAAMPSGPLRAAAHALDARLSGATFQSVVHGDAKIANFCFGPARVAMVDFQYVGGGCGMKDVAYFLSCLSEKTLERDAEALLDVYFAALRAELAARPRGEPTPHQPQAQAQNSPRSIDANAVEREWRALYPLAWADFERFLAGWAPGHAKLTGYSARLTEQALRSL